ncbi:MAG: carboxypeptidase regulatory-like domain-containing protein [Candidatus Pacebacteria bacterium]|nr:carboxypeptidase regulatory-like domain-containing protein [Candidatus Paceibacterota bacterium]
MSWYAYQHKKVVMTVCTVFLCCVCMLWHSVLPVYASVVDGTIDPSAKYAWGDVMGWINFGATHGNVHITDTQLTGYIWSPVYGWINLNPTTSGVKNDSEGHLSGYAWSAQRGWINFSGVSISTQGVFGGTATSDTAGTITFNCAQCLVKTDWRPASTRTSPTPTSVPYPGGAALPWGQATTTRSTSTLASTTMSIVTENENELSLFEKISRVPLALLRKILGKKTPPAAEIPLEQQLPKEAPLAFKGAWGLLPQKPINAFVLAPLPNELNRLAQKVPGLGKLFGEVGVNKVTDVRKLELAKFILPNLSQTTALPKGVIAKGDLRIPTNIPIGEVPSHIKEKIPTEVLFARSFGEKIDLNVALTVDDRGKPQQKIATITGKPITLIVRVDQPARSVKGYLVFKSKGKSVSVETGPVIAGENASPISAKDLMASALFSVPSFGEKAQNATIVPVEGGEVNTQAKNKKKSIAQETRLVLSEFDYEGPDEQGIYTAHLYAPVVSGEYEVITAIDYISPTLAQEEIRLVTVVDPEGYIYESDDGKEARIPGAIASLYWLNQETKEYELWPGEEFQQENPQVTDVRGTYSFLVPEGTYYLKVQAPGYQEYIGKPFQVKEGSGVHTNIEMRSTYWWLNIVDWKTILLALVTVLLLYNFYKDARRNREKAGST